MPDPTRLLHTLRQAVQQFRDTPGRRGRVITLASDSTEDVLVAGDLHGHVENFRRILQRADLANHPRRHLVLQEVIHGPFLYPDGGDKSHQLLDLVAALKCQYPRQVHFLIGNHELSQWTHRRIGKNDIDLNDLFRQGVENAYGSQGAEVYGVYLELFAAAAAVVRTPNRIFLSHSLPAAVNQAPGFLAGLHREEPSEADLFPGGCIHALVWGRDTRPETVASFLRLVDADFLISGHIPCDKGFDLPNDKQMILDALGDPACYCLFPATRPLTKDDLVGCIATI